MGNRKNQNRGRGKKKKRNSSSQNKPISEKESSSQEILPQQSQSLLKKNSSQEKKNHWYNSQLMKGFFLGLLASGIIGFTIYFIQSCESEETKTELIENQNANTDTLQLSLGVIEEAIRIVKKYQDETNKLLQQHPNAEEYEKDKQALNKKFDLYKDSLSKSIDSSLIKAKIDLQNMIVREIAYINAVDWSQIFDLGYSVFRIASDKKINLIYMSINQALIIDWNNAVLVGLDDKTILIKLHEIIDPKNRITLEDWSYGFTRNIIKLNMVSRTKMLQIEDREIYLGLLADNKEGIIGFVGFSSSNKQLDRKQILDYNKFQQMTQIDLNENRIN